MEMMTTSTLNPTEEKRNSKKPWLKWDWNPSLESTESLSKKEKPSWSASMTQMSGKLQETKIHTSFSVNPIWTEWDKVLKPEPIRSVTSPNPQSYLKEQKARKVMPPLMPLRLKNQLKKSTNRVLLLTTSRWLWNTPNAQELRQWRHWERTVTIQWMQLWSWPSDRLYDVVLS